MLDIELVKSTRTQRLREKVRADAIHSKQTTLGNTLETHNTEPPMAAPTQNKVIEITEIDTSMREDELALKIAFKLLPSRTVFSRVTVDLFFDEQKIDTRRFHILQGPLAADASEFTSVLDMTGASPGHHKLRVEMFEVWSSNEKLNCTSKEVTIDYVPVKREDRAISVRIIKSTASADLSVVSDVEGSLYREINEEIRREAHSKRDKW
jgi:hypothetical protein